MLSLIAVFIGFNDIPHRGVYLLIFGEVVGLAAGVIGITALVKAHRTGSFRPRGAIGGIVTGTLAALLAIPAIVLCLAFPTQFSNYLTCTSQAHTTSQQQACYDNFRKSVAKAMIGPAGRTRTSVTSGQRGGVA